MAHYVDEHQSSRVCNSKSNDCVLEIQSNLNLSYSEGVVTRLCPVHLQPTRPCKARHAIAILLFPKKEVYNVLTHRYLEGDRHHNGSLLENRTLDLLNGTSNRLHRSFNETAMLSNQSGLFQHYYNNSNHDALSSKCSSSN